MIAEGGGGAQVALLAHVEGEPGESDVTWAFEVAEGLRRGWAVEGIGPPVFVNEGVDSDHTVGALLRLPAVSDDPA